MGGVRKRIAIIDGLLLAPNLIHRYRFLAGS